MHPSLKPLEVKDSNEEQDQHQHDTGRSADTQRVVALKSIVVDYMVMTCGASPPLVMMRMESNTLKLPVMVISMKTAAATAWAT